MTCIISHGSALTFTVFVNFLIFLLSPLTQMGALKQVQSASLFPLPFVCAVKNVPSSLLLCKCPLLRWWIFTGLIQQQGLIEFPSLRFILSRHMVLHMWMNNTFTWTPKQWLHAKILMHRGRKCAAELSAPDYTVWSLCIVQFKMVPCRVGSN